MERIVIEIPAEPDSVDARVVVDQFDGQVQLHVEHEFANAAVVFTDQSQITATVKALQSQHDDLMWKKADDVVKRHYSDATKWRAQWQAYDDANGGEWSILEVELPGRPNHQPIAANTVEDDAAVEATSEVLGEVYDSPFEGSWVEGDWRRLT